MRRRSNQRITKIKKDFIEELLKRAEAMDVADGTSIQPPGSDLIPYPDMDNLRHWTRDYLLKGLTKVYPVKLDTDGQTYLTTLIDGLPLFTKLTKTVKYDTFMPAHLDESITVIGSPVIGDNGVVSGFSTANYLRTNISISDGDEYQIKFTTGSEIKVGTITRYVPPGRTYFLEINGNHSITTGWSKILAVIPTSEVEPNTTYWARIARPVAGKVTYGYSTDGVNFTSTTSTDTLVGSSDGLFIGVRVDSPDKVLQPFGGTIDLSDSYIISNGVKTYLWHPEGSTATAFETSKPGLWLSNLIQPVTDSVAGSWLRHNLIHSNESSYDNVNSDVIGNYTWAFFQRGILHRTAGSSHNNNDSYCQHWSPSALSCISHDAIIIPSNNLRSTYTSYQMPVVPNDANMQYYEETISKDVEYTFVDNNDNIPLTTTGFNGRVVGKDWSYELLFTPNHSGSSGNPSNNDSTGGCITGTITYYDPITDITCEQNINSCFETPQGTFNSNLPHNPDNQILDDKDIEVITRKFKLIGCCSSIADDFEIFNAGTYLASFSASVSCGTYSSNTPGPAYCYHEISNCGVGGSYRQFRFSDATEGWTLGWNSSGCPGGTWCGDNYGHGTFKLVKPSDIKEQNNVNIYMNIKDNKTEFEANGLPWTGNCNVPRFEISYSTEPCTSTYCTSKLIASNVDINSSGFVSNLTDLNLKG